ncbi:shikimate kinase, partial [Mycobacterium tuberculosis]
MKIILIGFMGTGKSSLGRKLAAQLEYEFLDTDDLIEAEQGCCI